MAFQTDLTGRVAVVTGASRGIGRAVALALAQAGADVCVNFVKSADGARAAVGDIEAAGRRAVAVQANVAKADDVIRLMAEARRSLGSIDILVNNAGIAPRRGVDDLTEADFDETISVNLKSAFLCSQHVIPDIRSRRRGRIINISSGAARGAGSIGLHYNASKAGMEGLTRGYAARVVKDGITVNAIAPSLVETDMMPASLEEASRRIPLGRPGRPEEVAQAVVMVVGNAYMTGQTIQLNGGTHFL